MRAKCRICNETIAINNLGRWTHIRDYVAEGYATPEYDHHAEPAPGTEYCKK